MNTKILTQHPEPQPEPAIEASFQISGRHVDTEVLKGRAMDEVLTEAQRKTGGEFWFNRKALRRYSAAVAAVAATEDR